MLRYPVVTYSAQTRAWVARTREKTICEKLSRAAMRCPDPDRTQAATWPARSRTAMAPWRAIMTGPARPVAGRPGTEPANSQPRHHHLLRPAVHLRRHLHRSP